MKPLKCGVRAGSPRPHLVRRPLFISSLRLASFTGTYPHPANFRIPPPSEQGRRKPSTTSYSTRHFEDTTCVEAFLDAKLGLLVKRYSTSFLLVIYRSAKSPESDAQPGNLNLSTPHMSVPRMSSGKHENPPVYCCVLLPQGFHQRRVGTKSHMSSAVRCEYLSEPQLPRWLRAGPLQLLPGVRPGRGRAVRTQGRASVRGRT